MSPAVVRTRWILAAATVMATLLYTIDSTIVNVALPHMQGSLQATQDQAAWIVTAYIVVSAIATPLAGWLGTRYGLRRVLLVAIVGFTVGSVLCGIANELAQMVGFRMLQGAFGAALVPLSQVVLLQEFPRSSHGRVMALWGVGVMVGPVIGPTLGGWLTDTLSWRWAFYINVPVGILAWLGVAAAMSKSRAERHRPFDLQGFILLSVAVGLFQLMLDRGETNDWFESTEIVAEAFFGVVAIYMFIVHSLTSRHPFVDIHLFRDRNFTVSLLVQFSVGMFVFSPSLLLPSFLQQLQGYTAAQAGILLAARGGASIVAMLISGRLANRLDARPTMLAGLLIVSGSLWMMASFSVDTPARDFLIAGVVQGFGIPFVFMPLTLVAFATLPDSSRTEAGVLLTLVRNVGGSAGISAVVALLARSAQVNQSYLAERFTPYAVERWQMVGAAPGANVATGTLLAEINRQALAIAYSNDFHLLAGAAFLCLPLVLMLRHARYFSRGAGQGQNPATVADAAH
ncbi:MAG TPA: DHA2 family efflux MFS transporter permease subunit [Steroidobacteraceae bacterium]|nr:DHA2 family efflux MFS transporter permease subunit [Steroidobacteraceae bacterium]